MKAKHAVLISLALACSHALASGAPWFRWRNVADNSVICSQIRPGDAWVVFQGPFMDATCRKKGYPQ